MDNLNTDAHVRGTQDEVSLVDLTVILVKGWKLLLGVFSIIVLLSIAFAWWQPTKYTYASVYQMAIDSEKVQPEEGEADNSLEAPEAVLNLTRLDYMPNAIREISREKGFSLPYSVAIEQPEDTLLLVLRSEATPEQQADIERLHQRILQPLVAHQEEQYERKKGFFENKLNSLSESLERLRQAQDSTSGLVATYQAEQGEVSARIAGLGEGEIAQLAAPSERPSNIGSLLIVGIGIVVGAFLAVMAVFFHHFVKLVRKRLADTA